MAAIRIDDVVFDIRNYPRRQADGRPNLSESLIETYADAWLVGDKFPAIIVVKTKDGALYLRDGAHRWMSRFLVRDRFRAGEIPGLTEELISAIEVIVVNEDSGADPEIEAGAPNCIHGARLAPRDLRRLIAKSYRLNPGVTAVDIARRFGCHRKSAEKRLKAAVADFKQEKYRFISALRNAGSTWERVALAFKQRWPEAKGADPSALRRFYEDFQPLGKKVTRTFLPDQSDDSSTVNALDSGSPPEPTAVDPADTDAARGAWEAAEASARERARKDEEQNRSQAQVTSTVPVSDDAPRLFIIQKNRERWRIQWDHLTDREREELDRVLSNAVASYEYRHAPNGDPNKVAWNQVTCPIDEADENLATDREKERERLTTSRISRQFRLPNFNRNKKEPSAELISAIRSGDDKKIMDLLKYGTDPNGKNADGYPYLYLAASYQIIQSRKVSPIAEKRACSMVLVLLKHKADVNAQAPDGKTALMAAVKVRYLNVIRLLLNHRADKSLVDSNGMTAMDMATTKKIRDLLAKC